MGPWAPYVVAATAVLAPTLLDEGAKLSLVPVFVTDAQRAAMAEFGKPILGVTQHDTSDLRALDRVDEVCRAMIPLRGAIDGRADLAQLTADDVDALLTACLAAARAGVDAGGYDVVPVAPAPATQLNLFDSIVAGQVTSSASLTSFGAAVREAALKRDFARASSGVADIVQVPGQLAAKDLALEMDSLGYLVTGKPFEPSVAGGLAAAAAAVEGFVGNIAGDAAGAAVGVVADVAFSTPGLLLIAGLIAWRVLR